jgi:DNA-binding response OmpR family regulator
MTSNKILIVDDNIDAADTAAFLLQAYGFNVEVAYGAYEALAAARTFCPDIIFLDIGMPLMDVGCRGITLIALTAWSDEASRIKVNAAGFDLHLVKPASIMDLVFAANYRTPKP